MPGMPSMGQGKNFSNGNGGRGLGTKGGKISLRDEIDAIIKKDPLLKQLVDSNVKINLKEVVFTAKDKSGQVVWLEKGDQDVGLTHIMKHESDFVAKHNISKGQLTPHLKNVVSKGKVVSSRLVTLHNGRKGLEKIYLYKGKYYTLGAIGTNGFIVSMYPIDGGE